MSTDFVAFEKKKYIHVTAINITISYLKKKSIKLTALKFCRSVM